MCYICLGGGESRGICQSDSHNTFTFRTLSYARNVVYRFPSHYKVCLNLGWCESLLNGK